MNNKYILILHLFLSMKLGLATELKNCNLKIEYEAIRILNLANVNLFLSHFIHFFFPLNLVNPSFKTPVLHDDLKLHN